MLPAYRYPKGNGDGWYPSVMDIQEVTTRRVIAIIARLSPRPDGQYEGVKSQEKWGRAYAARMWPGMPCEVFADEGVSATNGAERPELERFLRWVADGRIAHVWAVEQSRLSREVDGRYPWFAIAGQLDAAGIEKLHTDRDGIVRVRDEVAGIKAVLAAAEVRKMTQRINDRLGEIAASGQPPGVRPFGYRHARKGKGKDAPRTYAIVKDQADAIRWAADKVLAGWSLSNIAAELDAQGMRGTHGGKITASAVRTFLRAPSIAGIRVHKGREVGKGNWPPILDESQWRAVVAQLAQNRIVRRRDGGTYEISDVHRGQPKGLKYVLTGGLAVCGKCGHALVGTNKRMSNGRQKPYLVCHPKKGGKGCVGIMLPETEDHVAKLIFDGLDSPELLKAIADDTRQGERDDILAKLDGLTARRAELADLWTDGELTAAEWSRSRARMAERERELRDQLDQLPPPVVAFDLEHARTAYGSMTLDERRAFVRLFLERVTIHPSAMDGHKGFDDRRVTVDWHYPYR